MQTGATILVRRETHKLFEVGSFGIGACVWPSYFGWGAACGACVAGHDIPSIRMCSQQAHVPMSTGSEGGSKVREGDVPGGGAGRGPWADVI